MLVEVYEKFYERCSFAVCSTRGEGVYIRVKEKSKPWRPKMWVAVYEKFYERCSFAV